MMVIQQNIMEEDIYDDEFFEEEIEDNIGEAIY